MKLSALSALVVKLRKSMSKIEVKTMAEMLASGETPEILFWVGCSGSFDDRAKKNYKSNCTDFKSR